MAHSFRVTVAILLTALAFVIAQSFTLSPDTEAKDLLEASSSTNEKYLRHVVLFKFKESASAESVELLNQAFNALPQQIPVIKDFEWGLNDSPENLDQGFTHCYLLTFDSEEDRDSIYAPHPAHQAFVQSLEPHLEKVLVVDYWAN